MNVLDSPIVTGNPWAKVAIIGNNDFVEYARNYFNVNDLTDWKGQNSYMAFKRNFRETVYSIIKSCSLYYIEDISIYFNFPRVMSDSIYTGQFITNIICSYDTLSCFYRKPNNPYLNEKFKEEILKECDMFIILEVNGESTLDNDYIKQLIAKTNKIHFIEVNDLIKMSEEDEKYRRENHECIG